MLDVRLYGNPSPRQMVAMVMIAWGFSGQAYSQESAGNEAMPGESYEALADDGAWCWFSDPRAFYYQGKHRRIYAGWIDHNGNVTVGSYDLDSRLLNRKILDNVHETDDHDCPAMQITPEGRLMVFYSRHADATPLRIAVSGSPEDIDYWEPVRDLYLNDTVAYSGLLNSYTYANLCRLTSENNKLYLFWRGMDFKPNLSVSPDQGLTWEKGRILILPDRLYPNRRPYIKVSSNGVDDIDFAFTDGHPRNEPTNSIYYIRYRQGAFFKAGGEKTAGMNDLPLNLLAADKIYDASKTGEKAWIWDVAEDGNGSPVVVYVRFHGDTSHVYYYAKWDGHQWNNYRLADSGGWFPQTPEGTEEREPNYSGGLVLDHQDPGVVYLSIKRMHRFEIEKWVTPDGGKSWLISPVTRNSAHDNVRPFVIRNTPAGSSPKILWLNINHYVHYTDYRSSIRMDIRK